MMHSLNLSFGAVFFAYHHMHSKCGTDFWQQVWKCSSIYIHVLYIILKQTQSRNRLQKMDKIFSKLFLFVIGTNLGSLTSLFAIPPFRYVELSRHHTATASFVRSFPRNDVHFFEKIMMSQEYLTREGRQLHITWLTDGKHQTWRRKAKSW